MNNVWQSVRMLACMSLLTGLLYPLLITAIALVIMHSQATGSIARIDGVAVGSLLIGQKFTSEGYFWPRPSAVDYNPLPSGGSNLGPTSAALQHVVRERQSMLMEAHRVDPYEVPAELLFASGSGIDPHISPETAYFQMHRIASVRNLKVKVIKELVDSMTETSFMGILAPSCVNVLSLNIALDKLKPEAAQ